MKPGRMGSGLPARALIARAGAGPIPPHTLTAPMGARSDEMNNTKRAAAIFCGAIGGGLFGAAASEMVMAGSVTERALLLLILGVVVFGADR